MNLYKVCTEYAPMYVLADDIAEACSKIKLKFDTDGGVGPMGYHINSIQYMAKSDGSLCQGANLIL